MVNLKINKKKSPNMWDVSVGGHITYLESSLEAAKKEMKEEIGIEATEEDLELLFTEKREFTAKMKGKEIIIREFIDTYLYVMKEDKEVEDFKIQEEEISKIVWINFYVLNEYYKKDDERFVKSFEFQKIFDILLERDYLIIKNDSFNFY
jgi:isopentenyldiphosphate isomerase